MKTLNRDETIELYQQARCYTPRTPKNADDWGDEGTYGLQVKLRTIFLDKGINQFGEYLGKFENEYIIAVYEGVEYDIASGEAFLSIEEMKQRWELD